MSTPSDSSDDLGPAEAQIRAWRNTLRPGGPEVDPVAILAYVDKTLSVEDARYIQQLIHTFEAWSAMYWEIYAASLDRDEARILESPPTSCPSPRSTLHPPSPSVPNRTPANDGRRRVARWRWLAALTVLGGLCLAGYELLVARRATPIVATLRDGSQTVQVLANGDVRGLAAVSPTLLPFVRSALTTGRLTPAQPLPHLPGARSTPVRTPQLFEPCFTHVSTDQPTFRWQGARQATSYVVRVFAEEHTLLIESETLTSPQWCPPEPLPRGRVLAWEVGVTFPEGTTVLPNRPLLRPALRVLSEEEWDHYQAMASTLRDSHLAWGTYLVQAGLLDEALREFQSLRADNPHEPLAQQLLAAVNALRHAVSDSEPQ